MLSEGVPLWDLMTSYLNDSSQAEGRPENPLGGLSPSGWRHPLRWWCEGPRKRLGRPSRWGYGGAEARGPASTLPCWSPTAAGLEAQP